MKMIKKSMILVLVLVLVVTSSIFAFAEPAIEDVEGLEIERNDGKIDVQYYNHGLTKMKNASQWNALDLDNLTKTNSYTKDAEPGRNNWSDQVNPDGQVINIYQEDFMKAFLNKTAFSDETSPNLDDLVSDNAQRLTGFLDLSQIGSSESQLEVRVYSDDGVIFKYREKDSNASFMQIEEWDVNTGNKTPIAELSTSLIYEVEMDYFNWGGNGELTPMYKDGDTWKVIPKLCFFTDETLTKHPAPTVDSVSISGETFKEISIDNNKNEINIILDYKTGITDLNLDPIFESNGNPVELYGNDAFGTKISHDFTSTGYYKFHGQHGAYAVYSVTIVREDPIKTLMWISGKDEIIIEAASMSDTELVVTEDYVAGVYDQLDEVLDDEVTYELKTAVPGITCSSSGSVEIDKTVPHNTMFTVVAKSGDLTPIEKEVRIKQKTNSSFDPSIQISDAGNNGDPVYFEYGGQVYESDIVLQTGYNGATAIDGMLDLDFVLDIIEELDEETTLQTALQNYMKNEMVNYSIEWQLDDDAVSIIDEASGKITGAQESESIVATVTLVIYEMKNQVTDTAVFNFDPIELTDSINISVNFTEKEEPEEPEEPEDPEEPDEPSTPSTPSTPSSSTPNIRVSLDADFIELEYGASADPELRSFDFTETVRGTDDKRVRWSISSNDYLEIDDKGEVTFIDGVDVPPGLEDFSVTVTVRTVDGNKKATATVTLVEKTPLGAIEFYDPYVFGYPDNTFRPKNSVTRAEVATMFAKILKLNLDYPGTQKFSDVDNDQWYYNYIQALARTDIFIGEADGRFRPNDPITRAEMATVFAKFWKFLDTNVDSSKVTISDLDGQHWASEYIYMMYNAGIVTGFPDGSYKPNEPTLREQVVGMINTLIARPENIAPASKFGDITPAHWAYGNIEAASQPFIQQNIPLPE